MVSRKVPALGIDRLSPLKLFLILAVLTGFVATLPGCGGCRGTSTAAKKKKEEEEEKKKKKKKKSEKPKPDFEPIHVRMLPSPDPTLIDKNPTIRIKPGHWAALSETTKANNFDFLGELAVFPEAKGTSPPLPLEMDGANARLSVWRPASLPKGQAKPMETMIFIPKRLATAGSIYSIRSELRAARGGGLAEPANNLGNALKEYEHLMVVLSSNPAAYTQLDKLNSIRMPTVEGFENETLQYYFVVRPNAEKRVPLPVHPLAWTTTAYVIWDDINPAVLTKEQQEAMIDWLHWGGQLIVSGPNSLDKLKGSFLSPYLAAEVTETIKLEQAAFEEMNRVWSLPEQKKRNQLRSINILAERPMVGVRLKKHAEARDVAGTGGLVVERRVGGGRVAVTAFPLTDIRIRQWKNYDGFFNAALLRRPARTFRSDEFGNLGVAWANTQFSSMLTEPRMGSTIRYFTRDIGFLPDELHPEVTRAASSPNDVVPGVRIPGGGPAGVPPGVMMTQYGYQFEQPRPDTTGVHPDVDDWHFGGYIAAPQSGVAAWNDYGAASEAARQALTEAAGIEIPKAEFVLRVLAIYLLILVPLNWFIFWMIGRVEWAWMAAPIIAIVGAGAVIRLAQLDIGFARSRTEIAVLEVQSGYDKAHLTRYTAMYTSLSSSYRLAFADQSALALPFASPQGERAQQQLAAIPEVRFRRDKEYSLSGVKVSSNSTGMVHSEQMFSMKGKFTVSGDSQKGLTLKNTSDVKLQEVGLFRRTASGGVEIAYIKTLEPRTSIPLTFKPLAPGGKLWIPEWNQSEVLALANPNSPDGKGHVRLTRLARLAVERLRLSPGDIRLVGWTDDMLGGMDISPSAPQNVTYTLVLAHLVRGELPAVVPDTNVAEDYYEPPIDEEGNTVPAGEATIDATNPAAVDPALSQP